MIELKPIDRVFTALSHEEPDKVPIFIFATVHGAKILGKSYAEYFKKGEYVAKGQLELQKRVGHDCLYPLFYSGKEYEAFGGESMIQTHGPPEAGKPIFETAEDLLSYELPDPNGVSIQPVLEAQNILFEKKGDELPIINSVIAPLSLTVMLLGFEEWIDTIVEKPETAKQVIDYLIDYTIDLAKLLLESNATALGYSNALSSNQLISEREYRKISLDADQKFYRSIEEKPVYGVAGAKASGILPLLIEELSIPGIILSRKDDLGMMKEKYGDKIVLVGNLDNLSFSGWSDQEMKAEIKRCISEGARGGGYIISEHLGDIPEDVSLSTLKKMVSMRDRLGTY